MYYFRLKLTFTAQSLRPKTTQRKSLGRLGLTSIILNVR